MQKFEVELIFFLFLRTIVFKVMKAISYHFKFKNRLIYSSLKTNETCYYP